MNRNIESRVRKLELVTNMNALSGLSDEELKALIQGGYRMLIEEYGSLDAAVTALAKEPEFKQLSEHIAADLRQDWANQASTPATGD
ncbi:hypothetical protein OPKNFCMD_6832 [Methylobacterium crusticola]|uniref:DUF892 family protein n=1 Tax=Methylobacterium crusticola TaxID=1697972 RepID=A0ABQ4RBG5_9HYPH|nr:hypothetical protein [Methylobacterium crusticola]GJD54052.1 hypothetical protein OPKNFCMD_6832 [Methylobacterium crusticola]